MQKKYVDTLQRNLELEQLLRNYALHEDKESELKEQVAVQTKEADDLRQELERVRSEQNEVVDDTRSKIAGLEEDVHSLNDRNVKLEQESQILVEDHKRLRDLMYERDAQIADLQQKLATAKDGTRMDQLERENGELRKSLADRDAEHDQLILSLTKCEEQLEFMKDEKRELSEKLIDKQKEKVSALNEVIGKLRLEVVEKDELLARQKQEMEDVLRRMTQDDEKMLAQRTRMAQYEEKYGLKDAMAEIREKTQKLKNQDKTISTLTQKLNKSNLALQVWYVSVVGIDWTDFKLDGW